LPQLARRERLLFRLAVCPGFRGIPDVGGKPKVASVVRDSMASSSIRAFAKRDSVAGIRIHVTSQEVFS
jgi:hypothetical protein